VIDLKAEIEMRRATTVAWFVPVKVVNPMNGSHGHWTTRNRLAGEHHEETVVSAPKEIVWRFPVVVVLRRQYCGRSKPFDRNDNLPSSLKWVADGVAEVLGIDDGDERFQVVYEQERVKSTTEVGVMVTVIQGARIAQSLQFVE
jgi:hypothetical protein